jgi:hypothetical protein
VLISQEVIVAQEGFYLYCISDVSSGDASYGKGGIENSEEEIFPINHRDISAIVSRAEIKQYKPSRKNNLAHEMNIEKMMKIGNVVPFRFGMVANSKKEITKLLEDNYAKFKELLKTVDNRFEIGVKVSYPNLDDVLSHIGQTHPTIVQMKKDKRSVTGNQNMIIDVGKLIEKEVNDISMKYKDSIYAELSRFATKSVVGENLSTEMILNASFLIEKEREKEFEQLVHGLDEKYEGKLNFIFAGPFPPYSFVKF